MKRSELKEIIEKCCEEIDKNKYYKSQDAVLEIMQSIDIHHSYQTGCIVNALKTKKGDLPTNKQIAEINKRSKKYRQLEKLWLDTEPYLCMNRLKPIERINKTFYKYLVKNNFSDEWDCWSICKKYITGKSYRPNIRYEIVPYAGVFGIKLVDSDRLIAIRNTKRQIQEVLNYLEEK